MADKNTIQRVERVLHHHRIVAERYLPAKHANADVCACGSQHPQYDDGRWPTHSRHLAEQIAAAMTTTPA